MLRESKKVFFAPKGGEGGLYKNVPKSESPKVVFTYF